MRQVMIRCQAVIERRQDGSNRSGIDSAVCMSADRPINGTGIEACTAAYAKETFAQRTFEDSTTAVVEDYQVKLFGTIQLTRTAWSGDKGCVDRKFLTRRSSREHFKKWRHVREFRNYFFDSQYRDMDFGQ